MSKENNDNFMAKTAMKAPGVLVGSLVTFGVGKYALTHDEFGYPYQIALGFGAVLLGQEVASTVNESIEKYYCEKYQKN